MIAVDTSVWINYSNAISNDGVKILEETLINGIVVIPPIVFVELLSSPTLSSEAEKFFRRLPQLEILPDFFDRTANLRKALIKKKYKAKLGNCLIAQSCIDHHTPLVTDDEDFGNFKGFGLLLAKIRK